MATHPTQTADREAIQDQVRREFQRLNQLVESESDSRRFCEIVLAACVDITRSHCALLWQLDGNATPTLVDRSGDPPHAAAVAMIDPGNAQHAHLIEEVVQSERPLGMQSEAWDSAGSESTLPGAAPILLLLAPVFDDSNKCTGVLELVQRGDLERPAQDGYLRFLVKIAQLFQKWHQRNSPVYRISDTAGQQKKLDFVSEVHRHISPVETAYDIANESRRLLNCDRVSVAWWNGRRCKIKAISSQDRFDNRANVVRMLGKVATSSIRSNSEFWIVGDVDGVAPQVKKKIEDYRDEAHCRTLAVIPIFRPADPVHPVENRRRRSQPRKLGALIVEYFDQDVSRDQIADAMDLIVDQSQIALENARIHGEIFLFPVWQRLGWLQKLLFRDNLAKTLLGLVALCVLAAFLVFFPKELKMKVDGVMHPTVRRTIFSQTDGVIEELNVEERSPVRAGQVLLQMENPDLELQMQDIELQLETIEHQRVEALTQLSRSVLDANRKSELAGSLRLLEKRKSSLQKQLELLKRKQSFLEITSPIDGTVITPNPERRLMNFPVTANLAVLEIADLSGAWQLELDIPQNKVGYITEAMRAAQTQQNPDPIKVEFRVGTNPNLELEGRLVSISNRAVTTESGTLTFRAVVDPDEAQFHQLTDELRSGAGVTAKIHCGERSLGFVCFYQVIDWLRTHVFF